MTYQTPIPGFALSPSTRARIDTPRRRAKRPSTTDTPLQVAAAQAKRCELEALPSVTRVLCATTNGAGWTLLDEAGGVIKAGTAGRDFGEHHTLSIAIGKAVELAALSATDDSACHLTVRVQDKTFGYVNRVGTADDDGRGGRVRTLATRAMKVRVLLTVERVDSTPGVTQTAPAAEAGTPVPVPAASFGAGHYIDMFVQALQACAAHLSTGEVARYKITGMVGPVERQFIHSLTLALPAADGRELVPQVAPVAVEAGRTPEDYVSGLITALHACALNLSPGAGTEYQIMGRIGPAGRQLIHSLSREPAMSDVPDGLYDRPNAADDAAYASMAEAQAEGWRASRGGLPF